MIGVGWQDRRGARAGALAHWAAQARAHWLARDVLLPFVATRGMLLLVGLLGHAFVSRPEGKRLGEVSSQAWISIWSHWDAGWYLDIVRDGYVYTPGDATQSVAFLPLYPLLIKAVALVLGVHERAGWALIGIVLSNLLLVAALAWLIPLLRLDFDHQTAARAARYLLVFPTSLFLSAVYPESLWLLLSVGAFWAARHQRWWLAGVLGGLGVLSRPLGLFLVVPLALEYLAQRRFQLRALRPDVLWLGLIPLAFIGWGAYLYQLSGNPWLFHDAHAGWRQALGSPWGTLLKYVHAPLVRGPQHPLLDLGFVLVLLALAAATWKLVRPSYALFACLFLLGMISRGTLESVMRFGLELFPLFVVLAIAGRWRWFDRAYLAFGLGIGALFIVMFGLGYWVA